VDGCIQRCRRRSCRSAGSPRRTPQEEPRVAGYPWVGQPAFLFKSLTIRKPLSIQSHTDKKFVEWLHTVAPNLYKDAPPPLRLITICLSLLFYHRQSTDPNHKPEMAITLTPFRAMCGFRELNDICEFVLDLSPESFALGDISIVQIFVDSFLTRKRQGFNYQPPA
jgi:mannose-6-phosphate isomerase